ncbi:YfgM family protein [Roseimaritima sediminicola]|uniref:tetratricopeptide repeat protein n=1 Tax=Roseimaritima sediminicola TaxID=2662066 RepID=UPI0012983075|nr:tetratricopeptide repeat protein [Roseimaritima sediminicola]
MNSERRHELQKNELADALAVFFKKIEPYAPAILTGLIVLVIAALTFGYLQSRAANQRSDATLSYLLYSNQADLDALAGVERDYPGTPAATLALLAKADIELAEGIDGMYTLRDKSIAQLESAAVDYQQVLEETEEPLIRSRAALGLARAQESLGNVEEAIDAYRQVIEAAETEAMIEAAEERIAQLERPETQEFLAWFAEQKPELIDPAASPDVPSVDLLPDTPDISLPQTAPPAAPSPAAEMTVPAAEDTDEPTAEDGADEAAEPEEAETEMQLPPASEPAEDMPAEEMPAEETPAEETPAEETPAEDTPAEDAPAEETPVEEVSADEDGPTELAPATGE